MGNSLNSNDHSFFIEQCFVYREGILLSHTSNLSFLYTALSVSIHITVKLSLCLVTHTIKTYGKRLVNLDTR